MKSNYDIYEFREVKETDECSSYENIGMLYPVLTQFSPIKKRKWGMVWSFLDNSVRMHGMHKVTQYHALLFKAKCACLPLTEERYKRILDKTPMRAWK